MADDDPPDLLRVFLASPGDVGEEREFVRQYLESTLPKALFLQRPIAIDVVSWDHPAASVPMTADRTPQAGVTRFKRAPADCDIVIVILWSRLGTPLDPATMVRPDGSRFLSGTEWEYENAFNASPRPDILVYQRTDPPKIDLRAPSRTEALEQFDRVDAFVGRFKNADGSWKGGFTQYTGLAEFKTKLVNDLEQIVAERLKKPQPRAGQSAPTQTPPEPVAAIPLPDRCYGRDADTNAIVTALVSETPPIAVLVQGPGGIGKTTLTQQAANHDTVIARFGVRRWFVELETATDRDTFDAAILQALGLDATLGFDAALNRLAQERSLLVLDNLETPWGGDTLAVEQRLARLAAVPGLTLLASFRGDESVGGARWSLRHTVHPLSRSDAEALFLDIAPSIRPNDPHLSALLAALGGVPLAICLTARRGARHDALAELWTEWQAAGTAVAQLPGAAPGRLTSVPHSIEFSLRSSRLTEPGRRLFRLLGQLPAGIAEEDRRVLLAGDAFTVYEQLLGVGLAVRRDGRLDLLPLVRDHARRAHPPKGEDAEWFRHYLALTADLGPRVGREGGAEALERLVPELPNIEAAFDTAVAGGALEPAVAAQGGLTQAIRFGGLGSARALASLAVACASGSDVHGEASCIESLGDIGLARSDHDAARSRYEEALPLYRRAGSVLGEANCIWSLGNIALRRSDHDAARSRFEEALPLYRRVGDMLGEANCIWSLGDIALRRSDHDAARSRYEEALPLYRRVGSVLGEANCIRSLGDIALRRSDHDAARSRYEEALPLYRRVGDVLGEANCVKSLGDIALACSDHDAARSRYEEALPLYRRVGSVLGEANCVSGVGDVAMAKGNHGTAREGYEAALALYTRVHRVYSVALSHERLATVTSGAERDAHVLAAKQTWLAIGLPDRAAQVERRFPRPPHHPRTARRKPKRRPSGGNPPC